MTLSNRPLLPPGEREDEWGPELIHPWLSMPSWDPETETDYPPSPPPGEGEMHLPSPEAVPSLSGSPVPRPLAPPLTASWRGPGRAGRPAYIQLNGTTFEGCCGCGAGAGVDAGGRPRRRAGWALQPVDGWRQQLPAEAESVRSPQSAPVQPGTAGPCYRLRRRKGQSGIQEPWGTELCRRPYVNQTQLEVVLLDHKYGHRTTRRPCHNLRRSWREVRYGTELFQNFRIVTTPVHVPQCF